MSVLTTLHTQWYVGQELFLFTPSLAGLIISYNLQCPGVYTICCWCLLSLPPTFVLQIWVCSKGRWGACNLQQPCWILLFWEWACWPQTLPLSRLHAPHEKASYSMSRSLVSAQIQNQRFKISRDDLQPHGLADWPVTGPRQQQQIQAQTQNEKSLLCCKRKLETTRAPTRVVR